MSSLETKTYSLSEEQLVTMAAKGGVCPVCSAPSKTVRVYEDESHKTMCFGCIHPYRLMMAPIEHLVLQKPDGLEVHKDVHYDFLGSLLKYVQEAREELARKRAQK